MSKLSFWSSRIHPSTQRMCYEIWFQMDFYISNCFYMVFGFSLFNFAFYIVVWLVYRLRKNVPEKIKMNKDEEYLEYNNIKICKEKHPFCCFLNFLIIFQTYQITVFLIHALFHCIGNFTIPVGFFLIFAVILSYITVYLNHEEIYCFERMTENSKINCLCL